MAQYRLLIATALLGAALLTPGCQGQSSEAPAPEAIVTPHEETAALMQEVSEAAFEVPADGRLTEEQIRIYLEVRERQQSIRRAALNQLDQALPGDPVTPGPAETTEVAPEPEPGVEALEVVGDHADPATADLQAARELGYNPKEYLWIREQVREAQIARAALLLSRRLAQSRERYLARLEEEKSAAVTEDERAEIDRRIAEFQAGIAEAEPDLPPAVIFNAGLLDRYEERLAAVWAGEERLAAAPRRDHPAKAEAE